MFGWTVSTFDPNANECHGVIWVAYHHDFTGKRLRIAHTPTTCGPRWRTLSSTVVIIYNVLLCANCLQRFGTNAPPTCRLESAETSTCGLASAKGTKPR
jgi:hypothetical protein